MPAEDDWQRTLAFYEPSEWKITLKSGDVIVVFADSHGVEEGMRVFNLAIEGQPVSLLPVARIPDEIISDIEFKPGRTTPSSYE